jgi:uncharacterized OB-fold protein
MATPTTLTAAFERSLAAGEVRWLRCDSCGALRATLRTVCPSCLSQAAHWHPAATTGHVLSYLVARKAIATTLETPYIVVHVALDDGVRFTANLLDADPAAVRVDMRVRLAVDARRGRRLAQFFAADDPERGPTARPPASAPSHAR